MPILLKAGEVDAFLSMGNTGAAMAAAVLVVGRAAGVERPGLAALLPSTGSPALAIDVGANADSRPRHLLAFALMGQVYQQRVLGRAAPTVGVLSIGEEDAKGNSLVFETSELLAASNLKFEGHVEPRGIVAGKVDVVVCDGFTGNILIKAMEATAEYAFAELRTHVKARRLSQLGALLMRPSFFRELRRRTDYAQWGRRPAAGRQRGRDPGPRPLARGGGGERSAGRRAGRAGRAGANDRRRVERTLGLGLRPSRVRRPRPLRNSLSTWRSVRGSTSGMSASRRPTNKIMRTAATGRRSSLNRTAATTRRQQRTAQGPRGTYRCSQIRSTGPARPARPCATPQFDPNSIAYWRWFISIILFFTIVGIPLIPLWLLYSLWYGPQHLARMSARLTTQALEIRKGVFSRTEATIPLNRITDLRLHDGPLMRHFKLRGLKVETAGQSGPNSGSEGNLIGVVDAMEFRDAILLQRQKVVVGAESTAEAPKAADGAAELLAEIRDILARMEAKE